MPKYEADKKYKGYCVKYALTQGIAPVVVRAVPPRNSGENPRYAKVCSKMLHEAFLQLDKDFFIDKEAAEEKASKMAQQKLRAVEKQRVELLRLVTTPKYIDV